LANFAHNGELLNNSENFSFNKEGVSDLEEREKNWAAHD